MNNYQKFDKWIEQPKIRVTLVVILLLFVSSGALAFFPIRTRKVAGVATSIFAKPTIIPIPTSYSSITIASIINAINGQRMNNNLESLAENSQLDNAAMTMANDLVTNNYWANTTPDGNPPWSYIKNAGYNSSYAGILLGRNYSDPQSVIEAWMQDASDKKQITNNSYKDVGVSIKFGFSSELVVVVMLGTKYQPADNPQQNNQQTTTSYKNYGWYWHNRQSQQYIDGNWYSTPQQEVTPTPYQQYGSQQANSSNVQKQSDQIKQQEQSSNEQYIYNQCANNVNDKIKSCDSGCQSTLNQDNNICYSAYAAPNAYEGVSTDKYGECLNEVTAKYQSCLSSCDVNQTTDLQNCSSNAIQQSGVGH